MARILLSAMVVTLLASTMAGAQESFWVFVGTYTQGTDSKGIYRMELNPATGTLSEPQVAAETVNPSFLAVHPSRRFLYSVGEIGDFQGKKAGAVVAFALDPATGQLTELNKHPSGGEGPCFVTVGRQGTAALVANYGSGSVASLPIDPDGRLSMSPGSQIQHQGSSVNRQRQAGPHAHSINLDPSNRFAVAADLGLDKLLVYRFDPAAGTLTPHGSTDVKPGSGPRHFAFHPDGKHAYVINEMGMTITAFDYDPEKGELREIQSVPTLPRPTQNGDSTAEVVVHPSGKFVYGSNRGHDSIAIFAVDAATGRLTPQGHQSTQGKTPRNFAIDPTGRWLLAENQDSGTIVVFRIDPESGTLEPTGTTVRVPKPVCIKFVPKGA